ncbi:hypothetical protein [Algoriphagus halophilus]|uniref:hypothetical protein n=1 Tax=Algoriphagus halophilus TaxID=226505 RepID=UPI0013566FC5|nr:hypothetical protein [Algoriphagus halophilus]
MARNDGKTKNSQPKTFQVSPKTDKVRLLEKQDNEEGTDNQQPTSTTTFPTF